MMSIMYSIITIRAGHFPTPVHAYLVFPGDNQTLYPEFLSENKVLGFVHFRSRRQHFGETSL